MINQNDKYKDSSVEWIGMIPKTWNCIKLKFTIKSASSGGTPNSSYDSYYNENGIPWVTISDITHNDYIFDTEKHLTNLAIIDKRLKIYEKNTILLAMYASVGKVAELCVNATINQAILAIDFDNNKIINEFAKYCFNAYEPFIKSESNGTTQFNLNANKVLNLIIPFTDLSIQKKITTILNEKIYQINSLISNQKKQIEKLKEYKQALITKIVTNGLSDNPEMKSSGVEWIGKIPCGWNIYPIKYLFSFSKGLSITKEDLRESGIKVISYGQLHSKKNLSVKVDNSLYRFVSEKYLESNPECLVSVNDMIMADTSEDLEGTCDFVRIDKEEKIFAGYHSIIFQNKQKINTEYLAYQFTTDIWRNQFRSKVNGVKLFSLTQKILNQGLVILPDECNQKAIVDYINKKCGKIYQLIDIKQQKIEKLNEYKKSIIYEYVTGKKEVQL